MKHAPVADLTRIIQQISRGSDFGPRFHGVIVEPADDGLGGEFLRVSLRFDKTRDLTWETVKPLVTAIEDAVLEIDERFPSVRFPDP